MVKIKKKPDNSKLHWFWKITTKWWFFLVFYYSLYLIFNILYEFFRPGGYNSLDFHYTFFLIRRDGGIFGILSFLFRSIAGILGESLLSLLFFPFGLVAILDLIFPNSGDFLSFFPFFIGNAFIFSLMIAIPYFKYKKKQILKWLIIALFLVMILSFSGCVIGGIEKNWDFRFAP